MPKKNKIIISQSTIKEDNDIDTFKSAKSSNDNIDTFKTPKSNNDDKTFPKIISPNSLFDDITPLDTSSYKSVSNIVSPLILKKHNDNDIKPFVLDYTEFINYIKDVLNIVKKNNQEKILSTVIKPSSKSSSKKSISSNDIKPYSKSSSKKSISSNDIKPYSNNSSKKVNPGSSSKKSISSISSNDIKPSSKSSSSPNDIKPLLNSFDKEAIKYKPSSKSSSSSNDIKSSSKSSSSSNDIKSFSKSSSSSNDITSSSKSSSSKKSSSSSLDEKQIEICKKWSKIKLLYPDKLFNPITEYNIKLNGPKYKELEELCKKFKYSKKDLDDVNINSAEIMNYDNIDICKKWNKIKLLYPNKLYNPLTNRKIIVDGKTYKDLEKLCKKIKFDIDDLDDVNIKKVKKTKLTKPLTKELCKKWINDKFKNPITNKSIKRQGEIYKEIKHKCLK